MLIKTQSATLAALLILAAAANAQPKQGDVLANAGTLTCTTSETPPGALADAELSCNFRSPSGKEADFTGYIARTGGADLPPGKRVLVWSVLAESEDIGVPMLAGTYLGKTGGEPAGRLVGGEGRAIVLEPSTQDSQVGEVPVPTVLQLRLEPVQA